MPKEKGKENQIQKLISLSSALNAIPLRKLVPIHQTLISAIFFDKEIQEISMSDGKPELDNLIRQKLGDESGLFRGILIHDGSPQQKLLMVQYLLSYFSGLARLTQVLLPVLSYKATVSIFDEIEMREALLDATFYKISINDESKIEIDTSWFQELPLAWTCRILVRLHPIKKVEKLIMQVISQSIEEVETLQPIISWIFPLLFENNPSSEILSTLWNICVVLSEMTLSGNQKNLDYDTPLIASAILCSTLPNFIRIKLSPDACYDFSISLQQPTLWDFIYRLLHCDDAPVFHQNGKFRLDTVTVHQTLRRRGLFILRTLIEFLLKEGETLISLWWVKYIECFETFEMEIEQHLVDQIWGNVAELCTQASEFSPSDENVLFPIPNWKWISLMIRQILLSDTPVLRKLGLYRFLNGDMGIKTQYKDVISPLKHCRNTKLPKRQNKKAEKGSNTKFSGHSIVVPTDFVSKVVLPAFDTLNTSVGTTITIHHKGKTETHDIAPKVTEFILFYIEQLGKFDKKRLNVFVADILCPKTFGHLRPKTAVNFLTAVANGILMLSNDLILITEKTLITAVEGFQRLFQHKTIIVTFRQRIIHAFAIILSKTAPEGPLDTQTILKVLSLFPLNIKKEMPNFSTHAALKQWIINIYKSEQSVLDTAATCASSFVQLKLIPALNEKWNPVISNTITERSIGASIILLSSVTDESAASSSFLWPSIQEGLCICPSSTNLYHNADKASRAIILMENGCRLGILNEPGNGDPALNEIPQKTNPLSPQIEKLLTDVVSFLLNHIRSLSDSRNYQVDRQGKIIRSSAAAPSVSANQVSATFVKTISQLRVIAKSYSSSIIIQAALVEIIESSMKAIMPLEGEASADVVVSLTLMYAALSCKINLGHRTGHLFTEEICVKLLNLEFTSLNQGINNQVMQARRSLFHYTRWGCISIILPKVLEILDSSETSNLLEQVKIRANQLVEATSANGMVPLFDTVVVAARSSLLVCGKFPSYPDHMNEMIAILFAAMDNASSSVTSTYMLNETCRLFFSPSLLHDEYLRLQQNPNYEGPIRSAFRKLKKMSSNSRTYILRTAVSKICVGWLGSNDKDCTETGLSAIPYVEDIVELLVCKEKRFIESESKKSVTIELEHTAKDALSLPKNTPETSIVRGFLLVFLSQVPAPSNGLHKTVLRNLINPLILKIITGYCLAPLNVGSSLLFGSEDYSLRIRSWQALCALSRFITIDTADIVCDSIFRAFDYQLHGKIRYFLEIFAIQFARKHPKLFAARFVKEIYRFDLSLHQVSSLMVIGGNLIVGKYKADFFYQVNDDNDNIILHKILRGVIPWLSSTQGFSRAIAQLLIYSLIPMAIDISSEDEAEPENIWYLRGIFKFLDENPEMKRLRKKQIKAFNLYDVDYTCSVDGILNAKVDSGDEANPELLADLIKKCQEEVYTESCQNEGASWRKVEQSMTPNGEEVEIALKNIQRKLVPLDILDIKMKELREEQMFNSVGQKRQNLIICAALIDKIPNLGGLARTAEIFAVEQLVIPDKSVLKTETFRSVSVSAGNWIQIEECKIDSLLSWLKKKQKEGYTIIGLEQTSSSVSIEKYTFHEKTVLLLGKEKEGIPVHLLQLVDQCVEIPQRGIIRSLNVHVSAAICTWEYSKQFLPQLCK